jgi:hypothetical protein
MSICDSCAYLEYDEEMEEYVCSVNLDEDDLARFYQTHGKSCPMYRNGDEYMLVRKQI